MGCDDPTTIQKIISRAEARAVGLTRYFTGRPCKRGHVATRGVKGKACAECDRERIRRSVADHPEKWKAYSARYHLKHGPRRNQASKKWRSANKEKHWELTKSWRKQNPDRVRAIRKRYRANNPETVSANRRSVKARRRIAEKNAGSFKKSDIDNIFKMQKGKCAYCRASIKKCYEVDHIVPISRGGSNRPANLQLCCPPCNGRKAAADPIDYAKATGRLI